MNSLDAIWDPQKVRVNPFRHLNSMTIEFCEKIDTIFPQYMMGCFNHLEKLKIFECGLVKQIFDLNVTPQNNEAETETNLRFVYIAYIPNLKHIWNWDPEGILSFKNLQRIEVFDYNNLENLFPLSFAKGLEKLDYLHITGCLELQEIVKYEG